MDVSVIRCSSQIAGVVVYARGAVVTRRVALPGAIPDGPLSLVISNISPLADAGSLRATIEGDRELLGLDSRLVHPEIVQDPGALRDKLDAIQRDIDMLEALRTSAHAHNHRLRGCALETRPRRKMRKAPEARTRDALAASSLLDALVGQEDDRVEQLELQLHERRRALEAARVALAQANAEQSGRGSEPRRDMSVQISAGKGRLDKLEVSYNVSAARWWPAYTVRLSEGSTRASLAIEAFVAQATGEDWEGVELGLCTADMIRDVRLPELPSLRLGRKQAPRATGYRPPPGDLDLLFKGYDGAPPPPKGAVDDARTPRDKQEKSAFPDGAPQPAHERSKNAPTLVGGYARADEESDLGAPYPPQMMAFPSAAPLAKRGGGLLSAMGGAFDAAFGASEGSGMPAAASPVTRTLQESGAGGGGPGGRREQAPPEPAPLELAAVWLNFEMLVLLDPAHNPRRGRLERRPTPALGRAEWVAASIDTLEAPRGASDPLASRGLFDHRFDAEGRLDLASTGLPARVPLLSAEAPCRSVFRTTPRVTPEVFREVELDNPFEAPLLPGPADVFVDGALLRTSQIEAVDRGGVLRVGLGVEERLRVARNVRVNETSRGLLGGTIEIDHRVRVELSSSLSTPALVVVRDRIPVTDDKEVEIALRSSDPVAMPFDQADLGHPIRGGQEWTVQLPAGAKRTIEYEVAISLPSKRELVGGNRRE